MLPCDEQDAFVFAEQAFYVRVIHGDPPQLQLDERAMKEIIASDLTRPETKPEGVFSGML
jgi:hypothetical protein